MPPDSALLSAELPTLDYDTGIVRLTGADREVEVRVEIAASRRQQAQGLMEREALAADHGMLFVYRSIQSAAREFYMFRTRIPLDIAFIDEDGVIRRIAAMEPCELPDPEECPRYRATVPFLAALEVNRGFFERTGIGVGDRATLIREP